MKLLELGRELTELLTPHADFRLPLNAVICEYQKWFNRTLPFDPAVYGFSSFIDLLDVLPSIVEVYANLLSLACVDGGLRRSGKEQKSDRGGRGEKEGKRPLLLPTQATLLRLYLLSIDKQNITKDPWYTADLGKKLMAAN